MKAVCWHGRKDVRVEDVREGEPELMDLRQVAVGQLEHRVDQHGPAGDLIAEQIRVRRARGVEQLAEYQTTLQSNLDSLVQFP